MSQSLIMLLGAVAAAAAGYFLRGFFKQVFQLIVSAQEKRESERAKKKAQDDIKRRNAEHDRLRDIEGR